MQILDLVRWITDTLLCLSMVLTEFNCLVSFFHIMVESANVKFVTPLLIAHDPFVFLGMVQTLHGGVTLATFNTAWTSVPCYSCNQSLTIFWSIFKQVWRSSKISSMVCIDTTLGIMRIFLGWTPTRFVVEHIEDISLIFQGEQVIQILI